MKELAASIIVAAVWGSATAMAIAEKIPVNLNDPVGFCTALIVAAVTLWGILYIW